MNHEQGPKRPSLSPAPLLAAIGREIRERRKALAELEVAWRDALVQRDLARVRVLSDRAAEHRAEVARARAEEAVYSIWAAPLNLRREA